MSYTDTYTALDELVETCNKLCVTLDSVSNNELKHCAELAQQLEIWSWEALRMANGIKSVKEMI